MTAIQIALEPRRLARRAIGLLRPTWPKAMLGTGAVVGALAIEAPIVARLIVGVSVIVAFFLMALHARTLALQLVFIWLAFLGLTRRLLIPFIGWPAFDPLLLIGPVCAVILWITTPRTAERRAPNALAALGILLAGLAAAQSLNPQSPGLTGVLSAIFWIGPLLWFFLGRTIPDDLLERVFGMLPVLLVPVALLGFYQTFVGLLPFELTWVGVSEFGPSIFLAGFKIRPFSTLVSPQEYGYFLAFANMVLWVRLLTGRGAPPLNAILLFVGLAAQWFQGSRQPLAFLLLAMLITLLRRVRIRGVGLVATGLIAALVFFVLPNTGSQQVTETAAETQDIASSVTRHQISGFLDPSSSTLPLHGALIAQGFQNTLANPFGFGTGAGGIAVQKLQEDTVRSTENDIAQSFLSLGIAGGVAYVAFIIVAMVLAVRRSRDGSFVSLTVLGLLVTAMGVWWGGQMYMVSSVFWLALGTLANRPPPAPLPQEDHAAPA